MNGMRSSLPPFSICDQRRRVQHRLSGSASSIHVMERSSLPLEHHVLKRSSLPLEHDWQYMTGVR
jgi:hypothetical protein